mgnify:CR=1 FL=1
MLRMRLVHRLSTASPRCSESVANEQVHFGPAFEEPDETFSIVGRNFRPRNSPELDAHRRTDHRPIEKAADLGESLEARVSKEHAVDVRERIEKGEHATGLGWQSTEECVGRVSVSGAVGLQPC